MIESKTEPPTQSGQMLTAWGNGLQAAKQAIRQFGGWLRQSRASAPRSRSVKEALPPVVRSGLDAAGEWATHRRSRDSLSRLWRLLRAGSGDGPLWNRYALHLVIVCLAVGAVVAGQVRVPQLELLFPTPDLDSGLGGGIAADQPSNRGLLRGGNDDEVGIQLAPVAHTTIPERARTEVITYTVQVYDNMWSIATKFGLQVETMLWANPPVEQNPDLLSVDQVLNVPPVDGVYYTVRKGDSLAKLAKTYKTTVARITGLASNGVQEGSVLAVGQKLVLVGGKKPVPVATVRYPLTRVGSAPKGALKGSGKFAWPTRGQLSQKYYGGGHTGIDIANRVGTPVFAADDGYVVEAGTDTWGYGVQIVIDHGNGFWTRYAHLSRLYVTAGDIVKKNQRIADMGNTGRTTGPHLHFEIIKDQTQRNPLTYLP